MVTDEQSHSTKQIDETHEEKLLRVTVDFSDRWKNFWATLFSFLRKYKKTTALGIFVLFLISLIQVNYYRTNYEITVDTSGEPHVYQHEDPRTTGIVNYMTGKAPLPAREELPLYRQYVKNVRESSGMENPENIYSLSTAELDTLAIEWYKKQFPKHPTDEDSIKELVKNLFTNAIQPPLQNFGPEVNDRIWRLLIEVGAPKIRWVEEQDEDASKLVAASSGDKQIFYDFLDNTIYITYNDSVNSLLKEVGHAKQFRGKPVRSHIRLVYSWIVSFAKGAFAEAKQKYQANYQSADALEGEAHDVINPELLDKYGLQLLEEKVPDKAKLFELCEVPPK